MKWVAEDEMVREHHRLNGHEFEQTPGDSGGQKRLAMCTFSYPGPQKPPNFRRGSFMLLGFSIFCFQAEEEERALDRRSLVW